MDTNQTQAIGNAVPVNQRTTIGELAKKTEVSKSLRHSSIKEGAIGYCAPILDLLRSIEN